MNDSAAFHADPPFHAEPSHTGSSEPEVLSVGSPQDVLAFVPHTLGYWPESSLVVMAMDGKRLGASMRLDLPDRDASFADSLKYAKSVARHIRLDNSADGSLLALYAGIDWCDALDPGYDQLMVCLSQALGLVGMPVREAWWVGENRWRDYLCRDQDCCPLEGRLLKGIRDSALNAELIYRGSSYRQDLVEAMEVPAMSPDKRLKSMAAFQRELGRIGSQRPVGSVLTDSLRRWDAALTVKSSAAKRPVDTADSLGCLAALFGNPHIRDVVMVLALTDYDQAVDPGSVDLLLGSVELVPHWNRLGRLEELLRQILALHEVNFGSPGDLGQFAGTAERNSAAAALSALGWLEWCRGRGSRAGTYLDSALRVIPDYRLATLFLELLESGLLCSWAMDQKTAWQRDGPAAA